MNYKNMFEEYVKVLITNGESKKFNTYIEFLKYAESKYLKEESMFQLTKEEQEILQDRLKKYPLITNVLVQAIVKPIFNREICNEPLWQEFCDPMEKLAQDNLLNFIHADSVSEYVSKF